MNKWHTKHFVDQPTGKSVAELIADFVNKHYLKRDDFKILQANSRGVVAVLFFSSWYKVTCESCGWNETFLSADKDRARKTAYAEHKLGQDGQPSLCEEKAVYFRVEEVK